jgi:glycosyltransferase involved in cell wall biosynthesis
VTLLVEGLSAFPLAEPLKKYSRVLEMDEQAQLATDTLVASLPAGSPIICVIHRKTSAYSQEIQDRCDQFLCFTEAALEYRSTKIPPSKLRMVHHGVDLQRFRPSNEIPVQRKTRPNLLFYTRLDREEVTMWRVLEQLLRCDVRLTMLGDGDAFWKISDQYGGDLTLINHIPCHSIHNFLLHFDIVASAGRGILEALACGIPALCAGYEYGGPVLPSKPSRNAAGHPHGDVLGTRNLSSHGVGTWFS